MPLEEKIAKFISYLFHPLLMPIYGTLLVFYSNLDSFFVMPMVLKLFILLMISISTILMPVSGSLIMLKNGYIKSLMLSEREERRLPLLLTSIFYLLNFYLLNKLALTPSLKIFLLGSCIGIVLTMLISFFWKISTHMIGIGGLVGLLIGLSLRMESNLYQLIIIGLLISGIISFARLKLNTHTAAQVYLGFLLGVSSELGLFLLLL